MKKIYAFLSFNEKPILIVCCLISLVVTRSTADSLFSLLTSGKALHGRNLFIQFTFHTVLFLLLLAICLWLLRRPLRWLIRHPLVAFAITSILPLAAHAYMGSFSRFVADDFSSATLAVNKGILSATVDWYVNWSGRFSASFFDSVMGTLHPSMMKWETGVAICLILAGMTITVWQLIENQSKITRFSLSVLPPALILSCGFSLAPDLPQSLYWGQGMRSLILPFIPASFMAAMFIFMAKKDSPHPPVVMTALIALAAFIAGGFGETYVVLQITVIAWITMVVFFCPDLQLRRRLLPVLVVAFVSSIGAMMVTILAPGNRARQAFFPPSPDLLNLIRISLRSLGEFAAKIFGKPENWLFMFGLFISLYYIKCLCEIMGFKHLAPAKKHPFFSSMVRSSFFIILSFSTLLLASFLPAAYGMSTAPPDRTLILPSLILASFLAAAGYLFGSSSRGHNCSNIFQNRSAIWMLFVAFLLFNAYNAARILSPADDYRFFATRFDRADKMIRDARAAGLTSVEVPEVHNHFGLSDYGAGTTYWLDEAVNSYYGIDVIINKHKK